MYYVIEAVRWAPDGNISHVRWREVDTDGGDVITKSEPKDVQVVHAADTCREHEVRVYVPGPIGRFFKLRACAQGIEAAADEHGTPLRERMAHLPQF
jgi:hypothetical protein